MRKVIVILIVVILLLGISGCESVPTAHEEINLIDVANANNIALAINEYHALNPSEVTDFESLKYTKNHIGEYLWPAGLSDEEERAAWKLIVIEDWAANLTPEAQQAFQEGSRDDPSRYKNANATMIAKGINVYNALNPNDRLPDDVTLAEAKEALEGIGLWPSFMTDVQASKAWELIEISDGEAKVKGID